MSGKRYHRRRQSGLSVWLAVIVTAFTGGEWKVHSFTAENPSRAKTGLWSMPYRSSRTDQEDIFAAVHRKEHEMRQVRQQHRAPSDPVRMASAYGSESVGSLRLAKALRRVYDDVTNPANPQFVHDPATAKRQAQLQEIGMADLGMRRGSFVVDIKRCSRITHPNENFCNYDDAGMVAQAMVNLGADAVMVNVDYAAYGGDISELKSAVRAVRQSNNPQAAVVMKDLVVDEIQLGLAKEAGADGIYLCSAILGPSLASFLDLATAIGLETLVECHTLNEVQHALSLMAPNIVVNNYDRLQREYRPQQAIQLAGLFPGSGGPVICLATGGIADTNTMKKHLAVGYDGVIVGKAAMGSTKAPEFIRAVRDRTLLPAELSQWGLEDIEFDMEGNVMAGPRANVPDSDNIDPRDPEGAFYQ
jgi:indole-3-glycerol phosphate synthase